MPYNRDIGNFAPFPSGPLPTQEELAALGRRYRRRQPTALTRIVDQFFGHKSVRA